jgi:3-phenylpropionate/trans-cinnamate dioxygenase ferredoxin reductase component
VAGYAAAKRTQTFGKADDLLSPSQRSLYARKATCVPMQTANGHANQRDAIVIVGGGLAGQRCAETLRRAGHEGAVRMVCAETRPPYDRPPLSKQVLLGAVQGESLAYRPITWYEQHDVDLLLGVRATALLPRERRLSLSTGAALRYARALIATGSRPRTLPALVGYDNVSVLRTIEDATILRDVLAARPRLAVVGAGFIGQEVAASARAVGAQVTMIEAAACPLEGVLGPRLGGWFSDLHRAQGVDVVTGTTVDRVIGNGRVERLYLSNGRIIEADHVVAGVGVRSDTDWLAGGALATPSGIPADRDGRTAIDNVFAAGDAAATFDPELGRHVPGSHWEAAGRQGMRAARRMLGLDPGPAPLTSFWTDQYGIRIQYLGRARPADELQIDGDPTERSFTATFIRGGLPVAALLVDRVRALPAMRELIEKGAHRP